MTRYPALTRAVAFLSTGVALAALAGCSSVPLQVDEGPIPARTFSFMQAKAGGAEGGIADPRAELHAMVQDAIARHLSSRGLSRVPQGGDITVGYLVVVASNVTTQAITDYFGYGPENAAIIAKAHSKAGELRTSGPGSRVRDPATYRAGALVVDILDGRTLTLQYRNVAQREMLPAGTPADARAARIRQAVDELLGDLRISLRR